MKRLISLIAAFLLLPLPSLMAQDDVFSLDEAIVIALRDNRSVLLKAEEVKKAKEKISESKADFLPTLDYTGSWIYTSGYYAKGLGQVSSQAALKQYIYKGGKTINTLKYNGYNFEVAKAVLGKEKLETILNVRTAFFTLLLASEFADLNKAILENTGKHLDSLRQRYATGEAFESEILRVEASLSSVKEAYEASLNQIEATRALLRNLLYLDDKIRIIPRGDLSCQPKEVAYDEAFLRSIESRPEIRQYEMQAKAADKAIEIEKAGSRPNIYASWDYYSRSHAQALTGVSKKWNDYNVFGATFSWPIFDGWATKAKVEQAVIDLKEARLFKEKAIKDVALELKTAYLELKDSIAKIKSAEDRIISYKDALRGTEEKYSEGQASTLDVDDAAVGFQVSLFNQKEAIYDYLIARAKFDKASGG